LAGFGIAAPNFWIGMMLISVFAVGLRLLPATGVHDVFDSPVDTFRAMLLPVVALSLLSTAELARQVRSAMIESLSSDFTRTNIAKGLGLWSVYAKHALKNAGVPLITVVGLMVGRLLGGTVVIETVFGIPGVGGLIVEAVQSRDYPVIQAVVLLLSVSVVAVNLLTDLLVTLVDPRISHGSN
jgi:peptide/nickel transport system permease protein